MRETDSGDGRGGHSRDKRLPCHLLAGLKAHPLPERKEGVCAALSGLQVKPSPLRDHQLARWGREGLSKTARDCFSSPVSWGSPWSLVLCLHPWESRPSRGALG